MMTSPTPLTRSHMFAFGVLGNLLEFTENCSILQSHDYNLHCFSPQKSALTSGFWQKNPTPCRQGIRLTTATIKSHDHMVQFT